MLWLAVFATVLLLATVSLGLYLTVKSLNGKQRYERSQWIKILSYLSLVELAFTLLIWGLTAVSMYNFI